MDRKYIQILEDMQKQFEITGYPQHVRDIAVIFEEHCFICSQCGDRAPNEDQSPEMPGLCMACAQEASIKAFVEEREDSLLDTLSKTVDELAEHYKQEALKAKNKTVNSYYTGAFDALTGVSVVLKSRRPEILSRFIEKP